MQNKHESEGDLLTRRTPVSVLLLGAFLCLQPCGVYAAYANQGTDLVTQIGTWGTAEFSAQTVVSTLYLAKIVFMLGLAPCLLWGLARRTRWSWVSGVGLMASKVLTGPVLVLGSMFDLLIHRHPPAHRLYFVTALGFWAVYLLMALDLNRNSEWWAIEKQDRGAVMASRAGWAFWVFAILEFAPALIATYLELTAPH